MNDEERRKLRETIDYHFTAWHLSLLVWFGLLVECISLRWQKRG